MLIKRVDKSLIATVERYNKAGILSVRPLQLIQVNCLILNV